MTNRRWGHVKGEPMRFINGHNRKAGPAQRFAKRARFLPVMAGMNTPCWKPSQKPDKNGYVRVSDNARSLYAHVLMWEAKHGPVPDGLELDHLCRNRWCISPGHLEPVTRAVNTQRGATAKLTAAQVREIRQSDDRLRVLAKRYGVSITTVWQAKKGLTWADVAVPADDYLELVAMRERAL